MHTEITVDMTDEARCNLRCARTAAQSYCATYPTCVAGVAHRVQALFGHRHVVRQIVLEEKHRSPLGGHSRTRILQVPHSDQTVEEVELHCQTLKFESLLKTQPAEHKPAET